MSINISKRSSKKITAPVTVKKNSPAISKRGSAKEINVEELKPIVKCENCLNVSTDTTLNLSCKHILCGICLSRYLIQKDFVALSLNKTITIDCPICQIGSVATTMDTIKKILSETMIVRTQKRKEICNVHQIESEGFCLECNKWICAKCEEQFHKEFFSGHKLAPQEPNKKNYCALHNNTEKDLFCTDCNEEICHMCLRKGEYHYNHFNLTFEDFKKHTIDEKKDFKYTIYERFENVMYELENNFKRSFNDSFNDNKKFMEDIEASITKIKNEYLNKKEEYNAFIENYFQIIKMSYYNFYSDLKEKEPTIKTLNFIKSVIKEIDNVKFDSLYKGDFEKMSDDLHKIEPNKFFKYEINFFNHSLNLIRTFHENKGQIYSILQLSDGDLATAGDDKAINIYNIDTGKLKLSLEEHKKTIYNVIQLSNGFLASGSGDTDIKIWDLNNLEGKKEEEIKKSNEEVKVDKSSEMIKRIDQKEMENLYSDDKEKMMNSNINTSNKDNVINTSMTANQLNKSKTVPIIQSEIIQSNKLPYKSIATLRGHTKEVYNLSQINSEKLCSCSKDTLILIWSLKDYTCLQKLTGHSKSVGSLLLFSPSILISGSSDCKINIWDITKEQPLLDKLHGHTNGIFSIAKINDNQIVSASCDKTLKLWDINNKICQHTFIGHNGYVWSVIKLSDTKIASCSSDLTIMIWDVVEFKCVNTIKAHKWDITCLCLLKDGRIASGSVDKEAKIWEC